MATSISTGDKPKKHWVFGEIGPAANKKLGGMSVKDLMISAAKKGNIDPALLYSSAMVEGFNQVAAKGNQASPAYLNAVNGYSEFIDEDTNKVLKPRVNQNKLDSKAFPIDGFHDYGLDTFGDNYNNLKKYLPQGFESRFQFYDAYNDATRTDASGKKIPNPMKIRTAAFKTNEDALIAKAAFLNYNKDQVSGYVKQKGLTDLDQKTMDYFTLAAYNGGYGGAKTVIDEYYNSKDRANFIDKGLTSKKNIHTNIYPRVAVEGDARKALGLKYGGKIPKYPDGGEIDPITGQPKPQQLDANKTINPTFPETGEGFPSRDQQEGDIYTIIDNKGTVAPMPKTIVPLEQFYNQYTDGFGNIQNKGTGKYVSNTGQVNTQAQQQATNNQISTQNDLTAEATYTKKDNLEMAAGLGITAINEYFNKKDQGKQDRTNLRRAILGDTYKDNVNPYLEGTGSQAIMKKGGKMKNGGEINGDQNGLQTLDGGKTKMISSSDHSNPMIEFVGKTHDEGGIGVAYGGKVAEVEDKEVGWVDSEGGLNIFGKLKVPGTNTTFKSMAKNLAKEESKVDGEKSKYLNILNNGDEDSPYQESARSTAKVMFKSLDKQSKEIAEKKEGMASYQNLILGLTSQDTGHYKYGGKMPARPKYPLGGSVSGDDPKEVQKIIDKYSGGKSPLKAEDFIEVANKYDVPLELMLAQAIQESNIGTKGRAVRTRNIFNVGNTDSGAENDMGNFKSGLEAYARLIKSQYSVDGKIDIQGLINSNFKRPKLGDHYASDKNYGNRIASILKEMKAGDYSSPDQTASGDPYPKEFSNIGKFKAPQGLTPEIFYKNPDVVEALKKNKISVAGLDSKWGAEHDDTYNNLPQSVKDALGQSIQTQAVSGATSTSSTGTSTDDGSDYVPKYVPIEKKTGAFETQYGMANKNPTDFSGTVNVGNSDRKRGYLSPLALEQIAPELLAMATNKRDPVTQLSYQPELKQTFDLSYQSGRNENQSSFNQAAKMAEATGNVDALSQLAASKYKADESYNMQEVQGNAQQKLQTYGQNIDTLNDARVKNLALIADQQTKQAQATFNTRKEDQAAFTSMSGKVLQNELENKTYNAYANLFKHYGFDKKGNVTFNPDQVATKFSPGEAQQFGMLSAQKGASAIMNGDYSRQFTKVKNEDGSTTTTEVLGRNKQIQDDYQALKKQGFDDSMIGNMLRAKYPETVTQ